MAFFFQNVLKKCMKSLNLEDIHETFALVFKQNRKTKSTSRNLKARMPESPSILKIIALPASKKKDHLAALKEKLELDFTTPHPKKGDKNN